MSTRSSARNPFPPFDNLKLTIRRRSRIDPTLLNNSEMVAEGNGDLPETNFGLKNDMIQQVQNSCQFHGLPDDDANKHLDKFLHVTQSIKVNGVTDDALCLYLFPHSLTHHATAWFDRGTFMKRRPEECYDLIENMTAHHNDWDTSAQRSESSTSITASSDTQITELKDEMAEINKYLMRVLQPSLATLRTYMLREPIKGANQGQNPLPSYQDPVHQPQIPQPQVVTTIEFTNFMKANDAILKNMQTNMTSLTNSNLKLKNMFGQFMKMNAVSSLGSGTLRGNTIIDPQEELKGITTRSGAAYQGPTIPTTYYSLPLVVEHETEVTKDTMHPTNNGSIEDVQPLVVLTESPIQNSEPVVTPIIEPVASLVSAPKPNQRPSILYPSRLHDQKLRDKANDQREKFFQIFKDLNFNISFADALILMPKFGPSIKSLLTNKDKLYELARTPLNEHCSMVLLKKLPEKLGDPNNINLMPLSVWNKLSLPDLSPTYMTLELADRSISRLVGVAEDVFVKVGTFHFPSDFIVVDFDANPRVPLILERSFLKTGRALIDKFEEYSQEVLGLSGVIASGNLTPYYDPIVSTSSSTLTPFRNSDFHFEEVDAFLALDDDPTSPKVNQYYVDTEGDILLLEAFLNDDPSLPPPNQGNYLP
nr:hypothetical protein [Tanacetum cinerariifolium]